MKTNLRLQSVSLILAASLLIAFGTNQAAAYTFSLDDNPAAPIASPGGLIPGIGAENEFGLPSTTPPLAPSPSLFIAPFPGQGDATLYSGGILGPSMAPAGFGYLDAFSTNHRAPFENEAIQIMFSIDRLPDGKPGSAALAQSLLFQQPGDIYTSTASFLSPSLFVGALPPAAGYVGALPSAGSAPLGSNVLTLDESALGLTVTGVPGATTPPGVPGVPVGPLTHDNLDAFDLATIAGQVFATDSYFAVNPDEAFAVGGTAADIYFMPAGLPIGLPFATAPALGLTPSDSVDALVMFDRGQPGTLDPGLDFALFSLANGSASTLGIPGLFPNDVLFTDFNGSFATYALHSDVGLTVGVHPAGPGGGHNIDALEIIPEPSTTILALLAAAAVIAHRKRRKV